MSDKIAYLTALNIQPEMVALMSLTEKETVDAAVSDVLVSNSFWVLDKTGPFSLSLSDIEGRLGFEVYDAAGVSCAALVMSLAPFRRHIKDYKMICDSYYQAIREGAPHQIEAIDMARRGIHDDATDILYERLNAKIKLDFDTARRLFTLISVLKLTGA